jgi:hypothetical protein
MAKKRLILPIGSELFMIMDLPSKIRECQPMQRYLEELEMRENC